MLRLCGFAAAWLLIVASATSSFGEEVGTSSYYPLQVGTQWTLLYGDKEIVVKVTEHEQMGGLPSAQVDSYVGADAISSEHIAVTKEGIVRTAFGSIAPDKPLMFLKLPPQAGDKWQIDSVIAGAKVKGEFQTGTEEVTVPAGKFNTFKSSGEFTITAPDGQTTKTTMTYWFADGVGIVKGAMGPTVMELKKFTPAAK